MNDHVFLMNDHVFLINDHVFLINDHVFLMGGLSFLMGGLSLVHGRIIASSWTDVFWGRAGLRVGCKTRGAGGTAGGVQKADKKFGNVALFLCFRRYFCYLNSYGDGIDLLRSASKFRSFSRRFRRVS